MTLFGVFSVGAAGAVTLQKWNYPTLGTGVLARTYSAAATATIAASGAGPWPLQYARGTEGIGAVARTNTGLWTVTLQDNYQRILSITGHQSIAAGALNIVAFGENTTITNLSAAGGSIIGIAMVSATGTLADATSGSTITLRIKMHDATEP